MDTGRTRKPATGPSGRFQSLSEIAGSINQDEDLGRILTQIVESVCSHSAWSRSSLMRVDEPRGLSILVAEYSPFTVRGPEASREWQLSTSPNIEVLRNGRPMVIADATQAHDLPATEYIHRIVLVAGQASDPGEQGFDRSQSGE